MNWFSHSDLVETDLIGQFIRNERPDRMALATKEAPG